MIQEFQLEYLIPILKGALFTILLCLSSSFIGGIIGVIIGLGMLAKNKFIRKISSLYVQIVRGVPLLMLIFLIYFALPLIHPIFSTTATFSAVLSLSIYAAAYLAEIVRGSIQSIDKGQFEAADALGFSYWQKTRLVIFPQAFKYMIPPGIGFIIMLVKDSSLVSIIGFVDLARAGKIISNITFNPLLIFTIVAFIYFIICYVLSKVANYYEAKTS